MNITWIPLYALCLYWIIKKHRKLAWQFIFLTLVVFAVTDFTSASILKPLFMRVRPCYDPELHIKVRRPGRMWWKIWLAIIACIESFRDGIVLVFQYIVDEQPKMVLAVDMGIFDMLLRRCTWASIFPVMLLLGAFSELL